MAMINALFDTKENKLTITIDGRELDNVEYVCFQKEYEDKDIAHMTLEIERKDVDGMRVETRLWASEQKYTDFASDDKTLVDNKTNVTPEMHRLTKAIKANLK